MNRDEAAARAVRVAEGKGHTLGEWAEKTEIFSDSLCARCGHIAYVIGSANEWHVGGLATIYTCRGSGEFKGKLHINDHEAT